MFSLLTRLCCRIEEARVVQGYGSLRRDALNDARRPVAKGRGIRMAKEEPAVDLVVSRYHRKSEIAFNWKKVLRQFVVRGTPSESRILPDVVDEDRTVSLKRR